MKNKYKLIEDRMWDKTKPEIIECCTGTENECMEWIHKNHSFSFSEALINQGFRLEEVNNTRLFFVISSEESNEELFETQEEAEEYRISVMGTERGSSLRVALVRNSYFDEELKQWNYEDRSDTFTFIKSL